MQVLRRHELQQYGSNLISENLCFICKRTEAEIQDFLIQQVDLITEKYDLEIINLKSKLQNKKDHLKSHLDEVLNQTIKANLDIKTSLALSDVNSYTKNLPGIRDLVEMRKEFSNCVTLSDVRVRIIELRKELENDQIYEENRRLNFENDIGKNSVWYSDSGYFRHVASFHNKNKIQIGNLEIEEILESIEKLENERDIHLKSLEHQIELIKKIKHNRISRGTIDFPTIAGKEDQENYSIPITLPVCVICHSLGWHESTSIF